MLWQSSASRIICRTPPGATNWAIGAWGEFVGDGRWSQSNVFVKPESLYRAQLGQRDLRSRVGEVRIRVRGHQQERLGAKPPGPDARDVDEQLVTAQPEGSDDPGWKRVGR